MPSPSAPTSWLPSAPSHFWRFETLGPFNHGNRHRSRGAVGKRRCSDRSHRARRSSLQKGLPTRSAGLASPAAPYFAWPWPSLSTATGREDHRTLRASDEHRTAPRRIDPLVRPGRPRRCGPPQRRPRRRPVRAGPHRLRRRLPGYATTTPDLLQRRFLHTGGVILNHGNEIIARLDRRAYSPVLRQADLPTVAPLVGPPATELPIRLKLGSQSLRENRR